MSAAGQGRPEVLFPLFAGLETLPGIGPKTAQNMGQLAISRPRDVLLNLPHSGIDRQLRDTVLGAEFPSTVTVKVVVGQHRPPRSRGGAYRVQVEDSQTSFQLVFFHARTDYLQKLLPTGQPRVVSGRVELFDGVAQMVHPDHVLPMDEAAAIPTFEPVYPLTAGVSQKQMARAVHGALARVPQLPEWIDPTQKAQAGWPDWHRAMAMAHAPTGLDELAAHAPARARLAYDELMA
ncbi:MAG: OB-fold nucleic acid binding domain-containing protein, partial [Lutimaribacter sp.]